MNGADTKEFHRVRLAAMDFVRRFKELTATERLVNLEYLSLVNSKTGYAWAPQQDVAERLGVDSKSVRNAMIAAKRRGWWLIELDGRNYIYRPNFGAMKHRAKTDMSTPGENGHVAGENGHETPGENGHYNYNKIPGCSLPPSPPAHGSTETQQGSRQGENGTTQQGPALASLDGEVLGPGDDLTFEKFWEAVTGDDIGKPGPALAVFRKLSLVERQEIADVIRRERRICIQGYWASNYLLARGWKQPLPRAAKDDLQPKRGIMSVIDGMLSDGDLE